MKCEERAALGLGELLQGEIDPARALDLGGALFRPRRRILDRFEERAGRVAESAQSVNAANAVSLL